jgi:hypothetical protein
MTAILLEPKLGCCLESGVSSATNYLSTVSISTPVLPAGATAALLHQAYTYSQDLDNQSGGADCTAGCSRMLDTSLGDVFYQFFFVNGNGGLVPESSVYAISGT